MSSGYLQKKINYPYFKAFANAAQQLDNVGSGSANGFPFPNVDISGGIGGYSTTTHRYTVPVKGLYHFNIVLNIINNNAVATNETYNLGFNINNGEKTYVRKDSPEAWSTDEIEHVFDYSTILLLNANDTINVMITGNSSRQDIKAINTSLPGMQLSSYFEGYLISQFSS